MLFISLGALFHVHLFAQTPKIDSLQNILKIHPQTDTLRANTLLRLCQAYLLDLNNKKKIKEYAPELMTISQKLEFKKGIAYAYFNMGIIKSAQSDYEQSLNYYFRSLQLMQQLDDKSGIGFCYQYIGNIKDAQGKYDEAIQYKLDALKLKEAVDDKQSTASGCSALGVTYVNMGNYLEALNYHFRALKLREEINDKLGISTSLLNIGGVFYGQRNFSASLIYNEKALKLKKELGDKQGEAIIYINMASIYIAQKQYSEAQAFNFKSLQLAEELQDKQGANVGRINIATTYIEQHKYKEALPYLLKALKISTEMGDKANMITSSNSLGNCYEQQKEYSEALNYYTRALVISKEIRFKIEIVEAYRNLASLNEKLGYYDKALRYNRLHSESKDSLLGEESLKQSAELNTRYETDKKEKEILLLTKDQQLKDKTLKEQRLVRIGLIIGLGLFLALSFLLFNRYRFKQKANLILEKQKQEIHQKNVLITDSIDYAKTIQEAILPDNEELTAFFPHHFILYMPKATVSGDFYWVGKKDDRIICAVADCTGHGVPGAFMSLLGHNILENVVQRDTSVDPGAILSTLNREIVSRFSKGKEQETVKHGMDIAIISIDVKQQQLQYAGARNSLYLVRENQLTELKADKQSTGIVSRDHSMLNYSNNIHDLQKGDMIYLFSDGFPDQKGGPDKKKFFYQPFKELLLAISKLPVNGQKQKLDATITNWIGDGEQVDDILIMGIRW